MQQSLSWRRAMGIAGLVAIASWAGLGLAIGNVGLQRLVSGSVDRALEAPLALVAMFVLSAVVSWYFGRSVGARDALILIALLVVADFGGGLLAVALVGELDLDRIPLLMLVLSGYGAQLLGLAAGLLARQARGSARPNLR